MPHARVAATRRIACIRRTRGHFGWPSRVSARDPTARLPEAHTHFVPSKIDPPLSDRGTLSLDGALQLLQQSGHVLPGRRGAGDAAWLQAVIDGLCQLSSRDPLTGLANRRQFELTLASEVDRLRAAGVRFRNDVVTGPGGSQILALDPAGNIVEIFQPAARG